MATEVPHADSERSDVNTEGSNGLGPALRRAWIGYQLRLDAAMAEAGFGERRLPDGRVLRLCSGRSGSTISAIGRELGMTRQGAAKVVTRLTDSGYITVSDSATSGRERSATLTTRGINYLEAHHAATQAIERELQTLVGEAGFAGLLALLEALDHGDLPRMRTYLRRSAKE
jgi:DNA-binding MarR family transcriptional regulator